MSIQCTRHTVNDISTRLIVYTYGMEFDCRLVFDTQSILHVQKVTEHAADHVRTQTHIRFNIHVRPVFENERGSDGWMGE
jgi:hypothetical protein